MSLIFILSQNIECLQFEYLFTEMEEVLLFLFYDDLTTFKCDDFAVFA